MRIHLNKFMFDGYLFINIVKPTIKCKLQSVVLDILQETTLFRSVQSLLTFILLTWTKWRAPTNASKWRMGFNSAFKGLNACDEHR